MIVQCHDSPVSFCLEGVSGVLYAHVPFGVLCRMVHRVTWTPKQISSPVRRTDRTHTDHTSLQVSKTPNGQLTYPFFHNYESGEWCENCANTYSKWDPRDPYGCLRKGEYNWMHPLHPSPYHISEHSTISDDWMYHILNQLSFFWNIRKTSTTAKFWFVKPYKLCLYVYIYILCAVIYIYAYGSQVNYPSFLQRVSYHVVPCSGSGCRFARGSADFMNEILFKGGKKRCFCEMLEPICFFVKQMTWNLGHTWDTHLWILYIRD